MDKELKKFKSYECTALCLDIRNFTPTLEKYPTDEFYNLLHKVYCTGTNIAKCLMQKDKGKHLYINSTGDGFICVFFDDPNHYIKAYLMGILLLEKLPKLFDDFYNGKDDLSCDTTYKFGIGIESGNVVRIKTQSRGDAIETLIGDAINLAARIESKTKDYTDSPLIYGESLNQNLSMNILGKDYNELVRQANNPKSEAELEGVNKLMNDINGDLKSDFLHKHYIKGYKPGNRLYKISISEIKNLHTDDWTILNSSKMPTKVKSTFLELWKIDDLWNLTNIPPYLYLLKKNEDNKSGSTYSYIEPDSQL